MTSCSSIFKSKKKLLVHQRAHDTKKHFKCEVCGDHFDIESRLRNHMMIHDKIKPFACSHEGCTMAFTQKSNLKRHMRIHSGDKPFKCEYCHKAFASGSNLKQHLYTHETSKETQVYKCIFDNCNRTYKYPSSLKGHYILRHKKEYATNISRKVSAGDGDLDMIPIVQKGIRESSKKMVQTLEHNCVIGKRGRKKK